MRRKQLVALSCGALALALLGLGARALSGDRGQAPQKAETEARGEAVPARKTQKRAEAKAEPRVDTREKSPFKDSAASLRGTDIDGALRAGPDGMLVLGPEVLRLFDYFLTTDGEEDIEKIRARILAAIRERLDGPAAIQAAELLDKYLAYRKDAGSLRLPEDKATDPKARLEALREQRRKHFGEADAEKLFGDEEREGEVAIAESEVRRDETLTEEERAQKLAELDEKLPDSARAAREASTKALTTRATEEKMRAEGATDEDIRAYRVEQLGPEAADRLAKLDEERAAWKARVDAFKKERDKLLEQNLDEAAFATAEQAALDRSFTKLEQRRVRVILSMQAP